MKSSNFHSDFFRQIPKKISDAQIQAAVIYLLTSLKSEVYSFDTNEVNHPKASFRKLIAADNKKVFFEKLTFNKPDWVNDFRNGISNYLTSHRFKFIILATDYAPVNDLKSALQQCIPELLIPDIFPHKLSITFGIDNILFINGVEKYAEDIIVEASPQPVQYSYLTIFGKILGCPRLGPAIENICRSLKG